MFFYYVILNLDSFYLGWQVTKNRYDGELGHFSLSWHKDTCTLSGHFSHMTQMSHVHVDSLPVIPLSATASVKSNMASANIIRGVC